jgi:hypothetical protein
VGFTLAFVLQLRKKAWKNLSQGSHTQGEFKLQDLYQQQPTAQREIKSPVQLLRIFSMLYRHYLCVQRYTPADFDNMLFDLPRLHSSPIF